MRIFINGRQDREKLSEYMNLPLETLADRVSRILVCCIPELLSDHSISRTYIMYVQPRIDPGLPPTSFYRFVAAFAPNLWPTARRKLRGISVLTFQKKCTHCVVLCRSLLILCAPFVRRPFVCNTDGCGFTSAQKKNLEAHQRQQ